MNYQPNPYVKIQSLRTPAATAPRKESTKIPASTHMEDPMLMVPVTIITVKEDTPINTEEVIEEEMIAWPALRDFDAAAALWRLAAGDLHIGLLKRAELRLTIKSLDFIFKYSIINLLK